ncbi:hypothetical protein BGZ98_003254, partial [Dissophora globulifera]
MLDQRIGSNNRVSKHQVIEAEKHLMDSFSWSSEYQSSDLVRSVAGQVKIEIMQHYRNGTKILLAKLQKQQESTTLPNATFLEIRSEDSAIENFIRLNRLTKNAWKLCPMSPVK